MKINDTAAGTLMIASGEEVLELTPEDAVRLFQALPGFISSLGSPALRAEGDETVCPHCGHRAASGEEAVTEVDASIRWNTGGPLSDDGWPGSVHFGEGEHDYQTVAFTCYACAKVITLPHPTFNLIWS